MCLNTISSVFRSMLISTASWTNYSSLIWYLSCSRDLVYNLDPFSSYFHGL